MLRRLFMFLVQVSLVFPLWSQPVNGRLLFSQGQVLQVSQQVKNTITQQAMGNAIDFTVSGQIHHRYTVTNSTEDNTTLHHDVKRIGFNVEGMGPKRGFDSDNPKDLEGMFGPRVKELMGKTYDMILDPMGKVLLVKPEKMELSAGDERLMMVFNLLRDVTSAVFPPAKNEASFFRVLPDTAIGLKGSWTESGMTPDGRFSSTFTLSAITDTTILIDLTGTSTTVTRTDMMGMQITTRLNNTYTGTMVLDRKTGLLREKKVSTHSTGTTDGMGGATPVTTQNELHWLVTTLPG